MTAGVLAVLARLVSRNRNQPACYLGLEYGAVVISMLLVGPLVQDNYYTYVVIPIVAAAAVLISSGALGLAPVALSVALAVPVLYLCLPMLRAVYFALYAHYEAPLTGSTVLLTGALVYGLLAVAAATYAVLYWSRAQRHQNGSDVPVPRSFARS